MFRPLLQTVVGFAVCAGSVTAAELDSSTLASAKPNIIFIKTDDQRFDSLSMTGHPVSKMARAVAGIDLFVGSLRQQLEELSLANNTILVFISDHGLLLGEHGLGGKSFLYEESIRVPLIVYSPFFGERERGKTIDELVVGQDVPATILELCGRTVPETYQGESLVPLIAGRQTDWRTDVFCENLFTDQGYPRMEAVRGEKWKYIRNFSREHDRKRHLPDASIHGEQPFHEELFNLKDDPKEQFNLANQPEYKEVLERYRRRCQELVVDLAQ